MAELLNDTTDLFQGHDDRQILLNTLASVRGYPVLEPSQLHLILSKARGKGVQTPQRDHQLA